MNGNTKTLLLVIVGLLFTSAAGHAQQGVHTPKPGSSERKAIMDSMRLDFYRNNPAGAHRNSQGIFFKVFFLKVHGDWALANVVPVNAADKEITDPWWVLFQRKSGQWSQVDYVAALNNYESLHPGYPQTGDFDVLDMSALAIRTLWLALPDMPKDIFPDLKHRP